MFDQVRINPGGYYDNNTGVYTVPFSGTYEFYAHLDSIDQDSLWGYSIVVDDVSNTLSLAIDDDDGVYDDITTDSSLILELSPGQQVWVRPFEMNQAFGSLEDEMYSYFSGRLVTPA